MTRECVDGLWLCQDCGMVVANGTDGWGLDEAGRELGEVHAERMVEGWFVLSGCSEDEPCEFDHECRHDREFSSARCDGCGSTLAGHRFAAVEFVSE